MTTPEHSVTLLIQRLRASDPGAAQELWRRFFTQMVSAARHRLASSPRRAADEEDAALAAFLAFQQGIEHGRFPDLNSREDLWNLLFTLTVRAASGQLRHEGRLKRGGGESLTADVADAAPGPDDEAAFTDELSFALDRLEDEDLRAVALARLEGCTVEEIADRLGCSGVTVRRRLKLIRQTWEYLVEGDGKVDDD